jgi:hypothetical protein
MACRSLIRPNAYFYNGQAAGERWKWQSPGDRLAPIRRLSVAAPTGLWAARVPARLPRRTPRRPGHPPGPGMETQPRVRGGSALRRADPGPRSPSPGCPGCRPGRSSGSGRWKFARTSRPKRTPTDRQLPSAAHLPRPSPSARRQSRIRRLAPRHITPNWRTTTRLCANVGCDQNGD